MEPRVGASAPGLTQTHPILKQMARELIDGKINGRAILLIHTYICFQKNLVPDLISQGRVKAATSLGPHAALMLFIRIIERTK